MNRKNLISLILIILLSFGLKANSTENFDTTSAQEIKSAEEIISAFDSIENKAEEKPQIKTNKTKKTRKFFTRTQKNNNLEKKQNNENTTSPEKNNKIENENNTSGVYEETTEDNKTSKKSEIKTESETEVIVDSDIIEYFPEKHEFEAVGNAKVSFPSEKSMLVADKITFNHDTNYVKGFGNVVLIKEGQKITGDYIQVDLNENNAMMSKPVLNHMAIKIQAKEGIVYDAQTEALDGKITFNDKATYKFTARPLYGFDNPMLDEAIPKHFYFKEKYENKWRLKAKTIVIDSYKDRDVATLKNADIYIQDTKIGSAGKMRIFTDKEQQYIETNMLEIGSMRNIGAFISPGFVFQTPNASTLKLGPALTYGDSELGVGALGRLMTDKNKTAFGWASSYSRFVVKGEQEFTDDLKLQYGVNSYMNNFFLGSRMPKYGLQLMHHKKYDIKDLDATFQNRFVGGFYQDRNRDFSTTKFAWQTATNKNLFSYKNPDWKFAISSGVAFQTHAALYGTGDTMGVFRVGPYVKTQYRSWQQHLGFFQGGQAGDSPFYFDKNFYGKASVTLGESIRISKYLTLMYSGTIVVSGDTPNGKSLQENRFYFLIGPDDLKFIIGYDAYRKNATMGFSMNLGAENSDVTFKRLVLNDPDMIGKSDKKQKEKQIAQKRKAEEEKKKSNPLDRSVKDYDDYNPDFNMIPGGAMLHPSMIRPMGM